MDQETTSTGPMPNPLLRAEVAERVRVLVVAGIPAGVLVAGIGSRLAMLLLRVTSPDRVRGVESDDGFIIGKVTLGGTYGLLALCAVAGVIGAAAYRAVAPWLIGPTWFRRFTTSAASGAVVGSMLVHADGVDFNLLGPTWLAIGSFVALPAAFGWVIGAAVDRVAAPTSWTNRGRRRWALPLVCVALFPVALIPLAVATGVLALWVPAHREWRSQGHTVSGAGTPPVLRLLVRAGWVGVAVLGLLALIGDIDDIA